MRARRRSASGASVRIVRATIHVATAATKLRRSPMTTWKLSTPTDHGTTRGRLCSRPKAADCVSRSWSRARCEVPRSSQGAGAARRWVIRSPWQRTFERKGHTDAEDQLERDPSRTQDGGEGHRRPRRDRRGDQGPLKPAPRAPTHRQRALDWTHQGQPKLLPGLSALVETQQPRWFRFHVRGGDCH